jgi:phenylalanyl-tRNA synthetase beta chain
MRISYNWIKELVPDLWDSPKKVAELLTMHSFETEVIEEISIDPLVTVAKIIKIVPHPNADRLRLVTVDTGQIKPTVVCGAANISVGDVVPYSPEGTTLLDEEDKPFQLKKASIRGEESAGMLNSPRELGLGDWHGGIYLLPADVSVGASLADYITNDVILEADIEPNRAHDCLSHLGVAREIAALKQLKVKEPEVVEVSQDKLSDWKLDIFSPTDTLRYKGTLFSGVVITSSPLWLQARLWAMGAKPINNIVDISNYVMFEMGNPTHAFDTAQLPDKEIGVRRAGAKETFVALDEETYDLNEDDLVVVSDNKPIALAGVMGGMDSAVTSSTKEILLETANFKPYLVQATSANKKIETESAMRFKKGISPDLVKHASERAAHLLIELANASAVGVIEHYPQPVEVNVISYDPKRVSGLAGMEIEDTEIQDALERIRCEVDTGSTNWKVTVPLDRIDLVGSHDLTEEIIRSIGLDKIEATDPTTAKTSVALPNKVQWRESIRVLLVGRGFTETINYSFEDEKILQKLDKVPGPETRVKLTNPPAPERAFLRQSLVPQLVGNVVANKAEITKKFSNTEKSLFEIGHVFMVGEGGKVSGIIEKEYIAGVVVGDNGPGVVTQVISQINELLGKGEDNKYMDSIKILSPDSSVSKKIGQTITYFELNLDELVGGAEVEPSFELKAPTDKTQYMEPSKYPAVYRDLSLLVGLDVTIEQVQEIIERVGKDIVLDVDLFDTYEPEGSDKKGLAFHLAYQSDTKTLTDQEVVTAHNEIVATLQEELTAELRE